MHTNTCRDEILVAVKELIQKTKCSEFTLSEILEYMLTKGTIYKESTIRTHITSRMCANSPDNHAVTYDDFERTERGHYRLKY